MNIWTDEWLPVRTREGQEHTVSLAGLFASPGPAVEFLLPRPDLRFGALELLAGCVTLLLHLKTGGEFRAVQAKLPTEAGMRDLIAKSPLTDAFEIEGDGPCFLQDLKRDRAGFNRLSPLSLLLDYPGSETTTNNADLFNKRAVVADPVLSPGIAALALFILQANAPSGGRGHRTSLRGGGPLSTLVIPSDNASIAETLVANAQWGEKYQFGPQDKARILPWCAATKTSESTDRPLTVADFHPAQALFGMPRRIFFEIADAAGRVCAVTGASTPRVVSAVWTRHGGVNYGSVALTHPFSGFRENKKEGRSFAIKARAFGARWDDFVGAVIADSDRSVSPAETVMVYRREVLDGTPHVRIAGYATDKAKVLAYVEERLPLPLLPDEQTRQDCDIEVAKLVEAATVAARTLRSAVWYGVVSDGRSINGGSALMQATEQAFWQETRSSFMSQVHALNTALAAGQTAPPDWTEQWRRILKRVALAVFDQMAANDAANPKTQKDGDRVVWRVPQQRGYLMATLNGWSKAGKELYTKLGLALPEAKPMTQEKAA